MATMQEYGGAWRSGQARGTDRLAAGLGWFSIGLGLAEVAAPRSVARLIGVPQTERSRSFLRAYGIREIANGIGILQSGPDAEWLWGRVGGDAIDIGSLISALGDDRSDRARLLTAIGAVAGVTAADVLCAQQLSREFNGGRYASVETRRRGRIGARGGVGTKRGIRVARTYTINRQPDVVYGFWRQLDNLPKFMKHLESVEVLDDRRSRWTAKAPAGMTVQWEAEITEDRPNERLSWRSLPNATVPNHGSVRFDLAPGARGTELRVELEYEIPGGKVAQLVAKLFGEAPEQQIQDDLRRLKQLLEAGEVTRSEGSTSYWQPAQPLATRGREFSSEGGR